MLDAIMFLYAFTPPPPRAGIRVCASYARTNKYLFHYTEVMTNAFLDVDRYLLTGGLLVNRGTCVTRHSLSNSLLGDR